MGEASLALVLGLLWTAWAVQALLCAGQVAWFARRLGRPPKTYDRYRPRAWVIVPFKGIDEDLPSSVAALCTQEYPNYRLIFVLESAQDPAYPVIRRESARFPRQPCEIVFAAASPPRQGQKTHNQLAALRHIEARCGDDDVWVFADSDAVPDRHWLAAMVGPLGSSDRYGITTGYRWLVPASAQGKKPPLAATLASVMNSSVACLLGRPWTNFAWGGSMALRVQVARRGRLIERLQGALTDDYPLSRLCRQLKLKIRFVPQCLVASPCRFSFRELWNFGHRQYLITRVYTPGLYAAALAFTSLYVGGFATAWAWLLLHLKVQPWWSPAGWLAPLPAIAVTAWANGRRHDARRRAVSRAFTSELQQQLTAALRWDRWATPVWMTLHWLLVLRALLGRTMTWRGIRYRLLGPQRVERLTQPDAAIALADAAPSDTTCCSHGSPP